MQAVQPAPGGMTSVESIRASLTPGFADILFTFQTAVTQRVSDWRLLGRQLRATGSRECAPDDRLREAIHNCRRIEKLDCFVASLLAMT
ncbi:hypothetical protein [Bradyrhizobium sp. URHD0069]|uniref:hypothetical protein n=1 Tax=Bradyrhizobium sp. URHD0069 TaxID=1380355 RepID=UPI0012DFA1DD|nr:hypothetical protein [Bradyrhizobium sp. URHD0069]